MLQGKMNTPHHRDPLIPIIVSIVVATVLVVYPLSYELSAWRPQFMLMFMLFWVLCQPTWCGVWFAFSMGIANDLLVDAPLGLSALNFVLLAFTIRFLTRDRRILTFSNLWVILALTVFAFLLVMWLCYAMSGVEVSITRHWQSLLTTILAWPLLYYVLKKWRI